MRDSSLTKVKREFISLLNQYLKDYPNQKEYVEAKKKEIEELYKEVYE